MEPREGDSWRSPNSVSDEDPTVWIDPWDPWDFPNGSDDWDADDHEAHSATAESATDSEFWER